MEFQGLLSKIVLAVMWSIMYVNPGPVPYLNKECSMFIPTPNNTASIAFSIWIFVYCFCSLIGEWRINTGGADLDLLQHKFNCFLCSWNQGILSYDRQTVVTKSIKIIIFVILLIIEINLRTSSLVNKDKKIKWKQDNSVWKETNTKNFSKTFWIVTRKFL